MERNLELALVNRLRTGDTVAFDEIYDALNPRLFSFLCRMSRNRTVAEDLLEETWVSFLSCQDRLQPDSRLVPWLFTVARNLYVSYCRSRTREEAYTADLILLWPAAPVHSPYEIASLSEWERRIERALAALPPLYREALLLISEDDFRPTDAAAICGVTPEAFRQRLSRARAMLRSLLEDERAMAQSPFKELKQ